MKRFADFGIETNDKNIFPVPVTHIAEILNTEIEVLDYEGGVKTQHGEDRYVVKIRLDGKEQKFFTAAKPIKIALDKVDKKDFPFLTTIKQVKYDGGKNKTYHFT